MRIIDVSRADGLSSASKFEPVRDKQIEDTVRRIIDQVGAQGDRALRRLGRKFDSPDLKSLKVTEREIAQATVPDEWMTAIADSARRVREFHQRQLTVMTKGLKKSRGSRYWSTTGDFEPGALGQRLLPVASAGIYVPGGGAPYASSVLMNAIPALVAGVSRVAITSPPSADGSLAPAVLAACRHIGIKEVYKAGGAGAIAAFALGTKTIPRVDLVAGPGNRYVTEAKKQLWGRVGLDGFAGPSEVCVVADDEANAEWAAADLLTQIEHAPDNIPLLVTLSRAKADQILAAAERQLFGAAREATMREALATKGLTYVVRDLEQAAEAVNGLAPEHVTVAVKDPGSFLPMIRNAGCVLLGEYTPESAGDFALGPSHTLPTGAAARFGSPVNVLTFMKLQSVAYATREQLQALTPTIQAFGDMEGFPTHARGASIRFENL